MDFDVLRSLPKYHRRTFIALLILICAILIFGDYSLPKDEGSALHMLSEYFRTTVSAIIVGFLVYWMFVAFTPYGEGGGLDQLEPGRITQEFEEMLRQATRWRYKGNFGRYERGKVLPTLAGKPNAHASLSIIDPLNDALCQQHAEYRNGIQGIDKGRVYTAETVALEVVVTIVHCAWYVARRQVDINFYLSSVFDPVRIDSNDEAMILTVEDRRSPALKLAKQHFHVQPFRPPNEI